MTEDEKNILSFIRLGMDAHVALRMGERRRKKIATIMRADKLQLDEDMTPLGGEAILGAAPYILPNS